MLDKQPGFLRLCYRSFSLSVHFKNKGGFKHIYKFILDNFDNVVGDNEPDLANEPELVNEPDLANEPELANEPDLVNEPELANEPI